MNKKCPFFLFFTKGFNKNKNIAKPITLVKTTQDLLDRQRSLGKFQLTNLIEKKIPFDFFQLGDLVTPCHKDISKLLKTIQKTNVKELLNICKQKDRHQAILCLCEQGDISKIAVRKLLDMGFINVYFILAGLQGLHKEL